MNLLYEPRASTILYNLLVSYPRPNGAGRGMRKPFLLPANVHPFVPLTFLKAGVPFEFVDISPVTLHMDLEQAYARLETGQYGGLLYAHTYGETSTPSGFFAAAKALDASLLLIDDRCLCPPDAQPDLEMTADVTLYSTGPGKIVELDFGGYAFAKDEVIYQQNHLVFTEEALDALEKGHKAALASRQPFVYTDSPWLQTERAMPKWKDYFRAMADVHLLTMRQRMTLNAVYAANLPAEIQFPQNYQLWRFNIQVSNKQRLLDALFAEGLFASSHYASLAGIFAPGIAPEAEKLAAGVVNLFNNHHFTPEMAEKACQVITKNL